VHYTYPVKVAINGALTLARSASLASTSSSVPTRYLEKKTGTFGVLIRVKNCTFNFYNTDKKS
jgi:hypothetical protein